MKREKDIAKFKINSYCMNYLFLTILITSIIYFLVYFIYVRNWKYFLNLNTYNYLDEVQQNANNIDDIKSVICKDLVERTSMLHQMNYNDWINYNNKNIFLKNTANKYYVTIYEKKNDAESSSDNNFIIRATYPPNLINLNIEDEINAVTYNSIVFEAFPLNKDSINNMWVLEDPVNGCNTFSRYWFNPVSKRSVKQQEYFLKYKKIDGASTFSGIISIGVPIYDLESQYGDVYFNYFGPYFVVGMFLFTAVLSLILQRASRKGHVLSILTFVVLNSYLLYTYSKVGSITTISLEQNKINDTIHTIEAIGFLVAVNVFILDSLKTNSNYKYLYNESVLLFCVLISFLFISGFKNSNYATIDQVRNRSVQTETFFNIAIILNILIFFNYLYFMGFKLL